MRAGSVACSLLVLLMAACAGDDKSSDGDSAGGGGDSAAQGDSDTADGTSEDWDYEVPDWTGEGMKAAYGEIAWTVDYDEDAEAAGYEDCTYVRTYDGDENISAPWMCVECEFLFSANVQMLEGRDDCFTQVSSSDPAETEWIGYGGGLWYRGGSERGPSTVDGDIWTVSQQTDPYDAAQGGTYSFDIVGQLTLGEEEGDPMHGWQVSDSYSCGWPKADPAPYTGDYVLSEGATMPDGWFHDICEDTVRLHDFAGRYLVVEVSAMDCPPCRSAAEDEPAFVEAMAEAGIEVEVITMLAPSLSDTSGTPTSDELQEWIDAYDLHSPVLADRGWGPVMGRASQGDGFGYPTFFVVDPDLTVFHSQVGFSTYDDISAAISDHAGR